MQFIGENEPSFYTLGSHIRGFHVVKICDECKADSARLYFTSKPTKNTYGFEKKPRPDGFANARPCRKCQRSGVFVAFVAAAPTTCDKCGGCGWVDATKGKAVTQ